MRGKRRDEDEWEEDEGRGWMIMRGGGGMSMSGKRGDEEG